MPYINKEQMQKLERLSRSYENRLKRYKALQQADGMTPDMESLQHYHRGAAFATATFLEVVKNKDFRWNYDPTDKN